MTHTEPTPEHLRAVESVLMSKGFRQIYDEWTFDDDGDWNAEQRDCLRDIASAVLNVTRQLANAYEDALRRIAVHGPENQVCRASAATCRDAVVNIAQMAVNRSDGREAPDCKCAMTPNTFCPVHGEKPPPYGSNQSKGTNA